MTREQSKKNIKAILECYFSGFKEELIDSVVERIVDLDRKPEIKKTKEDKEEKMSFEEARTIFLNKGYIDIKVKSVKGITGFSIYRKKEYEEALEVISEWLKKEPNLWDENGELTEHGEMCRDCMFKGEEEYKRGWRDAIQAALSETYNVRTEGGAFRVIQEETLVGVGMSIERER